MVNPISFPQYNIDSRVDFSPLAQLGQVYQKAQQDQANKAAIAQFQQTGDTRALLGSGDMSLIKLGTEMEQTKRAEAFRQKTHADTVNYQNRSLGLQERTQKRLEDAEPQAVQTLRAAGLDPASPEGRKALFPKTDTPISAADKKTINAAEDELPNVEGTIAALKKAKELNEKTFTGYSAGLRGTAGTSGIPGANLLIDKDAAMATREWENIMSGEAVTTMADTLKGATTDFELQTFKKRLADPSTPPPIRKSIIERMLTLAEKQAAIKARRIQELRTGDYYKPGGATRPAKAISQQEYESLPSGSTFTAPDGTQRIKP